MPESEGNLGSDNDVDEINNDLSEAIKRLDKTQHIQAALQDNKKKCLEKASLPDLLRLLNTTTEHANIGKTLQKIKKQNTTLAKPLEKHEFEKIKRSVGFEEIKVKLDRWNAIVAKNRSAEHIRFPLLNSEDKKHESSDAFLSKYQMKSSLEAKLDELNPHIEVSVEQIFPLTMAEMIEHKKQIAKMRAKQSYKEVKARRQNKIKSKKFHRIQRKDKIKNQIKEFEILKTTNPDEALRRLEQFEKVRAKERVTLRHKSTGHWAKNKSVRAKYDKETRQQLAEQLALSKELTQKINIENGLESEEDVVDQNEEQKYDSNNPWMQKLDDGEYNNFVSGYKKYWEEHNKINAKIDDKNVNIDNLKNVETLTFEENEIIVEKNVDKINLKKGKNKVATKKLEKMKKKNISQGSINEWKIESSSNTSVNIDNKTSIDSMFENLETKYNEKIFKKLNTFNICDNNKTSKSNRNKKDNYDELTKLSFTRKKNKPTLDEELHEISNTNIENVKEYLNIPKQSEKYTDIKNGDGIPKIDPHTFVAPKQKHLLSALPDADLGEDFLDDDNNDENKKMTIAEAFEDDDIIANFMEEKREEINKNKPQVDDSLLPGWGSWTGKNLTVPKRRRKRTFFKMPKNMPRKDDKKDYLIIKEGVNQKLKSHLISELPFPFTSVDDFESSIRSPIGNTFIPETAHRKFIKPSVIVKTGQIIKPMDESHLVNIRNMNKNL